MNETLIGLGMNGWPFPSVPNEEITAHLCDRGWLRSQISALVAAWRLRSSTIVNLMWADVGAGKTHTLMHLRKVAAAAGFCTCYIVEMPERPKSFVDVHNTLLGAVGIDAVLELYLMNPAVFDRAPILKQVCRAVFSASQVEIAAENWASGIASTADIRRLGIPTRITIDQAVANVSAVVSALGTGAPKRTLVFVDEFQRVTHSGTRASAEIQGGISSVVNRVPEGLGLILSFASPPSSTLPDWIDRGLASRAGKSHFIPLTALTHNEAREFLSDLLDIYSPGRRSKFFPFSAGAVDKLISLSKEKKVLPRDLLSTAAHVFERNVSRLATGAIETIGPEDITLGL